MREPKLISRSLDQFKSRELSYLWAPFIPSRLITILAGEGGVGKSTLVSSIIRQITCGEKMPAFGDTAAERPVSGSAVYLCKEDLIEQMTKPRLDAAGAAMSKVHVIGFATADPDDFQVIDSLDDKVQEIERIIQNLGDVRALIIDPLTDFVGNRDIYRETDIREFLAPISRLAARYDVAVIAIMHLNKDDRKQPQHRLMGGAGIYNVARSVMFLGKAADETRYLMMAKANNRAEQRCVAFDLVSTDGRPTISWHPEWEDGVAIREMLKGTSQRASKLAGAIELLQRWLVSGPVKFTELEEKIAASPIGMTLFKKAKAEMKAHSLRVGGVWYWALEGHDRASIIVAPARRVARPSAIRRARPSALHS